MQIWSNENIILVDFSRQVDPESKTRVLGCEKPNLNQIQNSTTCQHFKIPFDVCSGGGHGSMMGWVPGSINVTSRNTLMHMLDGCFVAMLNFEPPISACNWSIWNVSNKFHFIQTLNTRLAIVSFMVAIIIWQFQGLKYAKMFEINCLWKQIPMQISKYLK